MPPSNQSQSSPHWPRDLCLWQSFIALSTCLFFCKKVSDSLEDFFCKRIRCDYEQVCTSWRSIFADSLRRDVPTVIVSAGIILVILSQRAFPTSRLSDLLHEGAKFVMAMGMWGVLVYDYEEVPWLDSCTFDRARRCYSVQRAGRAVVAGVVIFLSFFPTLANSYVELGLAAEPDEGVVRRRVVRRRRERRDPTERSPLLS